MRMGSTYLGKLRAYQYRPVEGLVEPSEEEVGIGKVEPRSMDDLLPADTSTSHPDLQSLEVPPLSRGTGTVDIFAGTSTLRQEGDCQADGVPARRSILSSL